MQMTMNSNAAAFAPRLLFARRGTMQRSEKRPSPGSYRSPEQGYDRPPRRRPPRAGFFYKLFTMLLLLVLWPIGIIMLWRRKLRWSPLTKIFVSVVTLMACLLLLGTALTANTHIPRITAMQNRAIDFMDRTVDSVVDLSMQLGQRVEISLEALRDIHRSTQGQGLMRAADAIDWGVGIAQAARARVDALFSGDHAPDATDSPEETEATGARETADIPDIGDASDDAGATDAPEEVEATAGASDSPEPEEVEATSEADEAEATAEATDAPEAQVTSAPARQIAVNAAGEELPVFIPSATPDPAGGSAIVSGVLGRDGVLDAGALPTPDPAAEVLSVALKPAAQATVYFNIKTGKYYHMASACGSMKSAPALTLADAGEHSHEPCSRCKPPEKSLLQEPYIAWMDEDDVAHLSDECADFKGQWHIITAEQAIEESRTGCPTCGADAYLAALAAGEPVDVESPAAGDDDAEIDAESTPEADAEPTPEPTPMVVTPRETLKPAADAIVYHSSTGKYYHASAQCKGMENGQPCALSEAISDGFQQCPNCAAPAEDAVEKLTLWQDEQGICHVSDDCKKFEGAYTLVDRDEALRAGLIACERCGAEDYLIPDTAIDTYRMDGDAA